MLINPAIPYLSDCRANLARAEVAWACARKSRAPQSVLDVTADELARARKSYHAACEETGADRANEHYAQCDAMVRAWAHAIALAEALNVGGMLTWMRDRQHQAGNTGD